MTVWDLSRLRYTVRKITGKFDTNQLPDSSPGSGLVSVSNPPGVDDYINDFYMYDFPEHMRTLKLDDWFIFNTLPNCGTYNVPQSIFQLQPPFYVDGYEFNWHQNPAEFYRIWPELDVITVAAAVGDGINPIFNFTLTASPIIQGSVVIGMQPNTPSPSQQLETLTDTDQPVLLDQPLNMKFINPGTLTGNLGSTGTIDYLTGNISITYVTPPPAGVNINVHFRPYVASRPRDALFFQQQIFLRPIPNDVFQIKIMAYNMPTAVISSATNAAQRSLLTSGGELQGAFNGTLTDVPQFNEWWQFLAYGAALKIFIEEGDHEEYARNKVYFEEAKLIAQRKTLKQLANQRIPTVYGGNPIDGPQVPIFPYY